VLPEPVMPTMTPCVVKSPDGTVVRVAVRSCLAGSICPPSRKSAMGGTLSRRVSSGVRGGLDAIGAATIAVQDVLGTSNGHIRTEGALEDLELGLTQRAARNGGVTDGAVVFDGDERVTVVANFGQ